MFWCAAPPWQLTDGLPHAQKSPILETRRWQIPRFHLCLRGWKLLTSGRTVKAFSLNVWLSIAAELGFINAVQLRLAFGTSPAARTTTGADDFFGNKFVCPPLGLEVALLAYGDKEALVFPFSYHQFPTKNVILYQARDSGPNIDQAMIVKILSECKSRGQWRTDQSVQRFGQRHSSGSRLFGAAQSNARVDRNLRTTCRPGAILGTSEGSAFDHMEFLVVQNVRIKRT